MEQDICYHLLITCNQSVLLKFSRAVLVEIFLVSKAESCPLGWVFQTYTDMHFILHLSCCKILRVATYEQIKPYHDTENQNLKIEQRLKQIKQLVEGTRMFVRNSKMFTLKNSNIGINRAFQDEKCHEAEPITRKVPTSCRNREYFL